MIERKENKRKKTCSSRQNNTTRRRILALQRCVCWMINLYLFSFYKERGICEVGGCSRERRLRIYICLRTYLFLSSYSSVYSSICRSLFLFICLFSTCLNIFLLSIYFYLLKERFNVPLSSERKREIDR